MKRSAVAGKRSGFSLVELVVVVLIMGILAAVAAPKLFNKMDDARSSATRQSMSVVRTAIDRYFVENEAYPADVSATAFVDGYLKGSFPVCDAVDSGNANVKVSTAGTKLAHDAASSQSWLYDSTSGEFRVNDSAKITW